MSNIGKKGIALLMSFIMASFLFLSGFTSVPEDHIYEVNIKLDGKEVTEAELIPGESLHLTAEHNMNKSSRYKWQINADGNGMWTDIYGMNTGECNITYALVYSALKEGRAEIRCQVTDKGVTATSKKIYIDVQRGQKEENENESFNVTEFSLDENNEEEETVKPEGNTKIYTITINYIYEDGRIANEPYVASIAEGTSFHDKVVSPQFVGYKPMREDGGNPDIVSLDYDSVTQDEEIVVTYVAQQVSYRILHMMQNLNDDNYTLFSTEKKTGKVGTMTEAEDLTKEGFFTLPFKNISIAADGSTVVEIFYDRIYYLMAFKLSGGYGIEPIFARFGTPVNLKTPVRPGYEFTGWNKLLKGPDDNFIADSEGNYKAESEFSVPPDTIPSEKSGYLANWKKSKAGYTIVYWKENADDDGYSFWGYKRDNGPAGDTVKISGDTTGAKGIDPEEVKHFVYNTEKSEKEITINGDGSSVINIYYDRKTYTLSFYKEGEGDYICGIPEHEHTFTEKKEIYYGGCYPGTGGIVPACGKEDHEHSKECLTCGKEEHKHTWECYRNVTGIYPSQPALDELGKDKPAPVNGEVREAMEYWLGFIPDEKYYFIFLNDKWYKGDTVASKNKPELKCTKEEHSHGMTCIGCGKEEHKHKYDHKEMKMTGGCYDELGNLVCKKQEHKHTAECGKGKIIKSVTAKYESDVADVWKPYVTGDDGTEYKKCLWIGGYNNKGDEIYYNFLEKMPGSNMTFKYKEANGSDKYIIRYYLELKDGESTEGKEIVTDGSRNYYLYYSSIMYAEKDSGFFGGGGLNTTKEDYFNITGYVQRDSIDPPPPFKDTGKKEHTAEFFYKLADPMLTEISYGETVHSENHKYGSDISMYGKEPKYPSTLEEGAYRFAGWYTTAECIKGSEFSFENATMAKEDLTVYAKWEPREFTVNFYSTAKLGTPLNEEPIVLKFGEKLNNMSIPPAPYPNVTFIGWFYDDNGIEKAIDFDEFRIKKSTDIYAKWAGIENVMYTVDYKLKDKDQKIGTTIQGYTKIGNNKTFEAKTGTALMPEYREGYYPLVGSHTVLMEPDKNNHFEFEYIYKEYTTYTVKYLDAETKEPVAPEKVVDKNKKAVVTENYKYIPKYVADAFHKRLIVTAEDKNNVITFYYTKNEEQNLAPYTISHYLQNAEHETEYEEYQTFNMQGTVGQKRVTTVLDLEGYHFVPERLKAGYYDQKGNYKKLEVNVQDNKNITITLPVEGANIEVYYDCNLYPYEVRHIDDSTGKNIVLTKAGKARYGQVLTFDALSGNNLPPAYDVYGMKQRSHRISIEDDPKKAVNNRIDFYYLEKQVTYQYVVVMKPKEYSGQSFGYLSRESEPVKVLSGTASGTEVVVTDSRFKFKGWYLDRDCTKPVEGSKYDSYLFDKNNLTKLCPQKEKVPGQTKPMYNLDKAKEGQIRFYALIEPEVGSIVIERKNASENQTFVYNIKGGDIDIEVSLKGNDTVVINNLPAGEYTVTEEGKWSWRYGNKIKDVFVNGGEKHKVTFDNKSTMLKWLNGLSIPIINRKTGA